MAAMAIVAILALAIVPQFGRYMERAAVQNVISDISSAQLLVASDYALSGKTAYAAADVTASVAATTKNTETTLTSAVNTTTNSYTITGTSLAVKNYTMVFDSNLGKLAVKRVS
ncbi:type II secretion system protein (plasmid) [Pseudarthrobacter sp. BIM B-2242]|nr:type II secretion system protein [Pseudarthrobacter sp. BIM B-2242]